MIGAVDAGEMVSLTASALAAPALGYTTLLRGKRTSHEVLGTIVPLFFAASCCPWALHYQSRLCERAATLPLRLLSSLTAACGATDGYLTVVSIYSALGFGVAHHHLCWCIGRPQRLHIALRSRQGVQR